MSDFPHSGHWTKKLLVDKIGDNAENLCIISSCKSYEINKFEKFVDYITGKTNKCPSQTPTVYIGRKVDSKKILCLKY